MGAWGHGPFQNDSALDWLGEAQSRGIEAVRSALEHAARVHADEYLDVDDGSAAVAAAEVLAAASGRGCENVPSTATSWVDRIAPDIVAGDLALARRALERVLAPESELASLSEGQGPDSGWQQHVRKLLSKLPESAAQDIPAPVPDEDPYLQSKQVLLTFLSARRLRPTDEQMTFIDASRDGAEVRRWLGRATSAASVAEVLAPSKQ